MDNESIFFFTKWITLSPDLHQNIPHTSCSELIENSTLGGSGENTPHAHTASYHHTTTTMPDCCWICVSLSSLSPESSSDSSEHLSRHFVDHPGVSVLFFLSRVSNFLWDPYFFQKSLSVFWFMNSDLNWVTWGRTCCSSFQKTADGKVCVLKWRAIRRKVPTWLHLQDVLCGSQTFKALHSSWMPDFKTGQVSQSQTPRVFWVKVLQLFWRDIVNRIWSDLKLFSSFSSFKLVCKNFGKETDTFNHFY